MTGPLDLHTVFAVCSMLMLVGGLCMVLVHFTGNPYPGFNYWMIGVLCQGVAYSLFANSQSLPALIATVGGNVCYSAHSLFCSRGLRLFAGRPPPGLLPFAGLAYVAAASYGFSFVHQSMTWRVALVSLCTMPFYADCVLLVWRDPAFRYRIVRRWLAGAFSLLILCALVRLGLMFLFEPSRQQIWAPSLVQALYVPATSAVNLSIVIGVIVLNFERAAAGLREHEQRLTEDVAARKRAEAALRESELRYRQLVELSPEAMLVHREGVIAFANTAAERMFAARPGLPLAGRKILDLTHPESRELVQERLRILQARGVSGTIGEMKLYRLDGTVIDVEVQSALVDFDGAPAVQVTARDVSERKRIAAEKQEFERKLQETQKLESLGVLAGGIAHDFNNILTGVLGNAGLAILDLPPGSPVAPNLKAIEEGARRAADLCRQLLAYSGKGNFVVAPCSLNDVVTETTKLLEVSISKRVTLRFALQPGLPQVIADVTQLRQVIMNLVINASEAIGTNDGVITLATGVARFDAATLAGGGLVVAPEAAGGDYVSLEVADNGCGMSAETQAKIFNPFFTTKFSGRGLGLAAVLGIMRAHKGVLRLVSDAGRGTKFTLLFPRAPVPAEAAAVATAAPAAAAPPAPAGTDRGHILVIDDEEPVRRTLALMLKKRGFTVALAEDGEAGCRVFAAERDRFLAALVDLTMPRKDGRQTVADLRALRPDLPVVLMSGFSEQEAAEQLPGGRRVSFLKKPFTYDDLGRVVHDAIAGS